LKRQQTRLTGFFNCAGNHALLAPDQLHLNTSDYVNTPAEAI